MDVALEDVSHLSFNECKKRCKTSKQKIGIIYLFESPSKKMYIGQTTSDRFSKRMNDHRTVDTCRAFHRAIKKYGWDTIINGFKILAFTNDLESLNDLEIKFIKQYDSFKNGYNLTEGGGGNRGLKHSLKTRKKISESQKKYFRDNPEARKTTLEAIKKSWKDPERLRKHREMVRKHLKAYNASEAGKKHRKHLIKKAQEANRKPIIATNLQTGESTQYVSARDAVKNLSALHKRRKFNFGNISACARKKRKTHLGYAFEFVNTSASLSNI